MAINRKYWKLLIALLHKKLWTFKLKIINQPLATEWSKWIISPTESYLETEKQGPYPVTKIEWFDINPIESKDTGRLMPVTATDRSKDLIVIFKRMLCFLSVGAQRFQDFYFAGSIFYCPLTVVYL